MARFHASAARSVTTAGLGSSPPLCERFFYRQPSADTQPSDHRKGRLRCTANSRARGVPTEALVLGYDLFLSSFPLSLHLGDQLYALPLNNCKADGITKRLGLVEAPKFSLKKLHSLYIIPRWRQKSAVNYLRSATFSCQHQHFTNATPTS